MSIHYVIIMRYGIIISLFLSKLLMMPPLDIQGHRQETITSWRWAMSARPWPRPRLGSKRTESEIFVIKKERINIFFQTSGSCQHRRADSSRTTGIGQGPASSDSGEGTADERASVHHSKLKARARDETSEKRNRKIGARSEQGPGNLQPMHHR